MAEELSVSELFAAAGQRLRSQFEFHRSTSPHEAQKGAEVEKVLREFLDKHLPRRFASASAHLIDTENTRSKQCDVAIYDALNSPVYRSSAESLILPIDHVATVIEVKTSLNKDELKDAYRKIASCKALKKAQPAATDRVLAGGPLATVATMGIVFAFASDTSLLTLAANARDLNKTYDSNLWPDLIVVLDKGVITYAAQFLGERNATAIVMAPCADDFAIPRHIRYFQLSTTDR